MTERSRPWQAGTGDGAAYSDEDWRLIMETLGLATGANVGVVPGILNELAVTSTGATNITANTGRAIADGTIYENDASNGLTTSAPGGSGTTGRRLVLRKDWTLRTVRLTIISSADDVTTLPALTQTDGVTWEIPLASFQIASGTGVITALTDEREWTNIPIASHRHLTKISTTRWMLPGWMIVLSTTGRNPAADVIQFIPFLLHRAVTFDRLGISVNVQSAGEFVHLGIYKATITSDGLIPGALALDATKISLTSAADKEVTIAKTLQPGWYFTALVDESTTPRYHGIDGGSAVSLPIGADAVSFTPPERIALVTAVDAGADYANNDLPDPAPAVVGWVGLSSVVTVLLREAA